MDSLFSKIKYLVLVLLLLIALVFIPTFLDHNGRKAMIEAKLAEFTGNKVKINGDVRIRTLPKPKIILDQVSMTDEEDVTFDVGVLEFDTPYSTVFGGDLNVEKVKIREGRFFYNDLRDMVAKNLSGQGVNIPEFEIDKITLLFDSKNLSYFDEIDDITGTLGYTGITGNNLNVDLKYKIDGRSYVLSADLSGFDSSGNADEATLNITSNDYKLRFFGKLSEFFSSPKLDGQLSVNFVSLDDLSGLSSPLYRMLRDDSYSIKADINLDYKLLSAKNITITADSITNANGEISYNFGENPDVNIKFAVEDFSLDNFLKIKDIEKGHRKSITQITNDFFTPLLTHFNLDFDNKTTGQIDIKFNNVNYNENAIKEVIFNAAFEKGDLLINDFSSTFPGEGVFEIRGSVTHNGIRPKLLGDINYNIKKFSEFAKWLKLDVADTLLKEGVSMNMSANIALIPRSIKFEKIKAFLGNTKLIGRLGIRKNSDEPININSNFRLNELNLDDFKIPQSVDNFITALYFYDADKYGKLLSAYVDDYKWIRTYPLESYFDVILDKIIYKGQEFKSIHLSSKLSPNNFEVDQLKISNNDLNLDGKIKMSMTALKPKLDIKMNSNRLDLAKFSSIFPNYEWLHQRYIEALANNKEIEDNAAKAIKADEDVLSSEEEVVEEGLTKEKPEEVKYPKIFNFLSLHNFDSVFDINFAGITDNKNPIKSFGIKGEVISGVVKIDSTAVKVFDGLLEANGSVVISSQVPSMSFSFAFNNFDPSKFLKYFYEYENFQGYMSVSGTLTGNGLNIENFKNRMYGRLDVLAKKITVKGFDLGEIIKTTEQPMTYDAKLERLKYYSQYGETLFNDLKGRIDFVNGLAAFEDFVFENNRAKGIYVGRVNYLNNIVNSITRVSFIPTGFNTVLTIDMSSKGQIANQQFSANMAEISKFLQTRSGDYQKFLQEEEERKSRSIIRNRRL